jgi:hypothetical protein
MQGTNSTPVNVNNIRKQRYLEQMKQERKLPSQTNWFKEFCVSLD